MSQSKFVALWAHRYKKYSHIFNAPLLGLSAAYYFFKKKLGLAKGARLVAFIRTEHFGDIVCVDPILRQVRKLHPNDHIVWFVKPAFRELAESNPNVNEIFVESCVSQRKVLLRTGVFDKVYDTQFHINNQCSICQTEILNPIAEQKGITVSNYFEFGNLTEVFSEASGVLLPSYSAPKLYLKEKHRLKINSIHLPNRFVAIHCQANYSPKNWPEKNWEKLVELLTKGHGYHVVEVGLESKLTVKNPYYHDLSGKLSFLETAELIRRAEFFIGLDSGPAHLANAVGTFGILVMGSLEDFVSYNPFSGKYGKGENCLIIRENGMPPASLEFDGVAEKINDAIERLIDERQER